MSSTLHHLPAALEDMRLRDKLGLYVQTLSTSPSRIFFEQLIFLLTSWVPTALGVGLRGVLYPLIMRARWPLLIEKNVTIHRPGALTLGRNVFLAENTYILAGGAGISIGEYSEILPNCVLMIRDYRGVTPPPRIEIGRHVGIGAGVVIFSHVQTRIGDDALIAPGAVITAGGHAYGDPSIPTRLQGVTAGDIDIGPSVWIGAKAVVLPGVRIGRGAVIGAGAVVAHDIPEHALAVGVPARVIRSWAPGRRPSDVS
jgi:acetyltransferase-like isoleucine patch superfamily enzyme